MNDTQLAELKDAFVKWNRAQYEAGRAYTDGRNWKIVCEHAARYGAPGAVSAFARALKELSDAGTIKVYQRIIPVPIPANFAELVNALTAGELRTKITPPPTFGKADANDLTANPVRDRAAGGYDAVFHDWFNRWSAGERPEGYGDAQQELQLTREAYYGIPAATALRRYQSDPAFARAVDRLFASGEVRSTNITGAGS